MNNEYYTTDHSDSYNESDFFSKVRETLGSIPFLKEALALYFCLIDTRTPLYVKVLIVGALGYFISPVDAIPDVIVGLGYVDDAGVISGVLGAVSMHVTEEHHRQADQWLYGKKQASTTDEQEETAW